MESMKQCTSIELEEAIHQFGDMVYRLAYSYCRNKADADDIFQDTFLKYMKVSPVFESQEHQKAWLIRVTINCAKSSLTSFWKRNVVGIVGEIGFTEQDEQSLAETLKGLSRQHRLVIHLYYYEGYSTAEIAGLLKKKASTIRTQLTRAREQLAVMIKEDEKCLRAATKE